jgi:ABC-type antimicrobial peptide transport system permease subunit
MTVVGVATDTDADAVVREHRRTVYLPLEQYDSPKVAIIVRGEASGASLIQPFRAALQSTLPMVAVYDLRPVAEELGLGTQGFRLAAVLLVSTGGFALLVTWVGLYAVTAYLVSRRLREFGLMRALGARDRDIYSSVVTPVLRTVGIGASSGILVSVALVGLARHYLVGFGTAGWGLVLVVPIVLSAVILVAALVPAWRATQQEPMGLLRQT